MMKKRIILIDLDGVLNIYTGNFNKDYIPEIKTGAKELVEKLSKDFEIKLFTIRNKILASKWLIENGLDEYISDITNTKEMCWLYIDDRCVRFDGDFGRLCENIQDFKPWYNDFVKDLSQ